MHADVDPLIMCAWLGFQRCSARCKVKTPCFGRCGPNVLLLSSSSRKLSDLHHRLIAGASNAGSPPGRRASRHTQTLSLRLYSVILSRILRKCLTQNKAACTKRDRQSRADNQLQPPVYGVPEGFAADPQHPILINQQSVFYGL